MTNKKGLPQTKTKGVNVRASKEYLNRANPSKSTSNAIMQWRSMDKKSRMEKVLGGKLSDERYKQINRLLNAKTKTGDNSDKDTKFAFKALASNIRNDPGAINKEARSEDKNTRFFNSRKLDKKAKDDILKLVRPLEQSSRATTQRKRVDSLKSLVGIKRKTPTQKSKGPR
tara:strand:- start:48 stop:560 length:513 start_codon:yes stop_codon:yes gene_type:complete